MAELTIKKTENREMAKSIPIEDAKQLIKIIQEKTKWDISNFIKMIISNEVDSISLSKIKPQVRLYMGKGLETIYFSLDTYKETLELRVPIKAFLEDIS